MRFGQTAQDEAAPGAEHADGLLAARIKDAGMPSLLRHSVACMPLTVVAHQDASNPDVDSLQGLCYRITSRSSAESPEQDGESGSASQGSTACMMGGGCAGWEVHHVAGRCLYDHNPSPQRCARMGGVWDDSGSAVGHAGGECITEAQAQQRYDAAAGAIEMETVQLSHDGGLAGFGELGATSTIRRGGLLACYWTVCLQKAHSSAREASVEDQALCTVMHC